MTKWITSDMHFNHAKIIEYCDRPFETTEEMNEIIIRNWNKKIKKKDIVYVLGDIGFDREQLSKIIPRLN